MTHVEVPHRPQTEVMTEASADSVEKTDDAARSSLYVRRHHLPDPRGERRLQPKEAGMVWCVRN